MHLISTTIKASLPTAAEGRKLKAVSDEKEDNKDAAKSEDAKKVTPASAAEATKADAASAVCAAAPSTSTPAPRI